MQKEVLINGAKRHFWKNLVSVQDTYSFPKSLFGLWSNPSAFLVKHYQQSFEGILGLEPNSWITNIITYFSGSTYCSVWKCYIHSSLKLSLGQLDPKILSWFILKSVQTGFGHWESWRDNKIDVIQTWRLFGIFD